MARSTEIGMCTFDQALYQLYTEDRISLDEALHNADSRTDLALRIRLAAGFRRRMLAICPSTRPRPSSRLHGYLTAGALMQHWPFPPFFGMPQGMTPWRGRGHRLHHHERNPPRCTGAVLTFRHS